MVMDIHNMCAPVPRHHTKTPKTLMNIHLYKAIAPKDPKTGEVQGIKHPNLEVYSFILSTALTSALVIWAVWEYLH